MGMNSVVVYCGARHGHKAVYGEMAFRLGAALASKKIRTVYGGGNLGLMGKVADGVLSKEGAITGIMPNFLAKLAIAHETVTELLLVDTMHERKARMVALSDGVIALPGGYGTLDEFFEILTWRQLGIYEGPIGLLNVNGFYDHLLAHFDKMLEEDFISEEHMSLFFVEEVPELLIERMEAFYTENKGAKTSL
jgi:uncharacterized protein (TIGR00730 family)